MIYDLHTHSTHSDGMLIPAEVARTAQVQGYLGIALTDHVDSSIAALLVPGVTGSDIVSP